MASGKVSKKIRQQYAREFRSEVKDEARKLISEKTAEMDDAIKQLHDKVFKSRPKWIPSIFWRWGISVFCNLSELELNGLLK